MSPLISLVDALPDQVDIVAVCLGTELNEAYSG
jgi:hypothetical protein